MKKEGESTGHACDPAVLCLTAARMVSSLGENRRVPLPADNLLLPPDKAEDVGNSVWLHW